VPPRESLEQDSASCWRGGPRRRRALTRQERPGVPPEEAQEIEIAGVAQARPGLVK